MVSSRVRGNKTPGWRPPTEHASRPFWGVSLSWRSGIRSSSSCCVRAHGKPRSWRSSQRTREEAKSEVCPSICLRPEACLGGAIFVSSYRLFGCVFVRGPGFCLGLPTNRVPAPKKRRTHLWTFPKTLGLTPASLIRLPSSALGFLQSPAFQRAPLLRRFVCGSLFQVNQQHIGCVFEGQHCKVHLQNK